MGKRVSLFSLALILSTFAGTIALGQSAFATTQNEFKAMIREYLPKTPLCPSELPLVGDFHHFHCLKGFQCRENDFQVKAYCEVSDDGKTELHIDGLNGGAMESHLVFDQAKWDQISGVIFFNHINNMKTTGVDIEILKVIPLNEGLKIEYRALRGSAKVKTGEWTIRRGSIFGQFFERFETHNAIISTVEARDTWVPK